MHPVPLGESDSGGIRDSIPCDSISLTKTHTPCCIVFSKILSHIDKSILVKNIQRKYNLLPAEFFPLALTKNPKHMYFRTSIIIYFFLNFHPLDFKPPCTDFALPRIPFWNVLLSISTDSGNVHVSRLSALHVVSITTNKNFFTKILNEKKLFSFIKKFRNLAFMVGYPLVSVAEQNLFYS